jgi:hypothetical protein
MTSSLPKLYKLAGRCSGKLSKYKSLSRYCHGQHRLASREVPRTSQLSDSYLTGLLFLLIQEVAPCPPSRWESSPSAMNMLSSSHVCWLQNCSVTRYTELGNRKSTPGLPNEGCYQIGYLPFATGWTASFRPMFGSSPCNDFTSWASLGREAPTANSRFPAFPITKT